MKKVFLCVFVVLGVLTSCQGSVKQQTNSRDSVMSQADSVVVDSSVVVDEKMPPKSVDGLFDDFIYSFMTNRRFQMPGPVPNRICSRSNGIMIVCILRNKRIS